MPLSGSQMAYLPARSGLERSGACRSNYFATYGNARTLNAVITINAVNVSSSVIISSLRIAQALNDQPDTASFTLKPGATIPSVNQLVSIGLGDNVNLIFAGQVIRVTHKRRMFPTPAPFVEVECVDWQRLFDRRLITYEWSSTSADAIALAIVAGWTSGFTTVNVASGLPTIDYFPCTNEKPSVALRRLVNLMGGGGTYIDPARDLHFFPSTGETGIGAPSVPLSITNTRDNLLSFSHSYDSSQQRTRDRVEGKRTTCPISIPASVTSADRYPLRDAGQIDSGGGYVRMGSNIIAYSNAQGPSLANGANPPGATITADVAAGDTTIHTTTTTGFSSYIGWALVGTQVIRWHTVIVTGLDDIPASGFGSIQAPIKTGAQVTILGYFDPTDGQTIRALPVDSEVVQHIVVNDATAQTALAAVEGGDGIHEDIVSDGRLSLVGGTARGTADLTTFKTELLSAEWETEDMNATTGGQQSIALTTTDALTATLTITDVGITFPILNYLPRRHCQGSTVRLAQLADITVTGA